MAGVYKELLDYIEGKSIAIIGSGASILRKEHGNDIDSHDIVIRINRGYPYKRYRKYVGSRTDIWSFGMGGRDDLRKKMHFLFFDRKFSIYPWYESSWVPHYLRKDPRHITLPPNFSRAAMRGCGGKPATTGADTLNFLVTGTKYKSITIYGIDFYQTGYWFKEEDNSISISCNIKAEVAKQKLSHQVDIEEKFVINLVNTYERLVLVA